MTSLSVIVPTIGRTSLWDTLLSVAWQAEPGDEVIVCGDGSRPVARALCQLAGYPRVSYLETPETHDWGATQREAAMREARGTHLVWIDDDDVFRVGAFVAIRSAVREHPDSALLFRIRCRVGLIWQERRVRLGNVGTGCLVVPNDPSRLGHWGARYEGDLDFITSTLAHYGGPIWREEVLIEARRTFRDVLREGLE